MKLAVQIASWITIVICGLIMFSAMFKGDAALFIGSLMYGVAPVLAVIYFSQNKQ